MTFKGNYNPSTTYSVGDIVLFTDGRCYHLLHPAKSGVPPVNTLYWNPLDTQIEQGIKLALDAADIVVDQKLSIANNLTTTAAGKVLDARQGKALKGLIDDLTDRVAALEPPASEGGES